MTMKKKAKTEKILFNQLESFFQSKSTWIIAISLVASFIISMVLFNRDVSTGGDDSGYIKSAYDFTRGIAFPSFHSPFYSIILSFFVLIFGVKVFLLKFVSILFNLGAIYFLFRFFKKYANSTIATFVAITTSINYLISNYASTTYSESFSLFFLIIFIYYFIELVNKTDNSKESFRNYWKHYLLFGVASYLLFLTKTVALAVTGASVIYLLINKQYKNSAIFLSSTVVFHFLLSFVKRLIWSTSKVGFEDQLELLRLKDPYKAQSGLEDFMGFVQRFWDNSLLYLSKHIMKMVGIFPTDYTKTSLFITVVIITLLLGSAVFIAIKNRKMIHVLLSVAGMIGVTFFVLQKNWDQERLIMIYFPLLIGFVFYALYLLFSSQQLKRFQFVVILLMGTVVVLNAKQTIFQIQKKQNDKRFENGEFGSYTPDWQNYMLACKWAGNNLPKDAVVLSRKPDMAWIASSGKDIFSGVYRIEYQNVDSVYNMVVEKKATHVILENFRLNPKKKTERTVTTIRNLLTYLNYKNPGCLKLVKEFGNDEKAYLFEINLNIQVNSEQYFQNLDNALIVNPKNTNIYIDKARYIRGKKGVDEALNVYAAGLSISPQDPYLLFNRGLLIFEKGNFKDALVDFKKATDFKPDFNQAWYNQAICQFYLKNYQDAKFALEKAKATGIKNFQQFEQTLSAYN
jgi:hypothetical protein